MVFVQKLIVQFYYYSFINIFIFAYEATDLNTKSFLNNQLCNNTYSNAVKKYTREYDVCMVPMKQSKNEIILGLAIIDCL